MMRGAKQISTSQAWVDKLVDEYKLQYVNQENKGPEEKFRIGLSRRTRKLVESSGVNSVSTKQ